MLSKEDCECFLGVRTCRDTITYLYTIWTHLALRFSLCSKSQNAIDEDFETVQKPRRGRVSFRVVLVNTFVRRSVAQGGEGKLTTLMPGERVLHDYKNLCLLDHEAIERAINHNG